MGRESYVAHRLLDGLQGYEIGGAAHNGFGLNTKNINCGPGDGKLKIDIVAEGDCLPLEDNSTDFIVSSHVLEHFFDPVKAIKEWLRVVKPGGYVLSIIPHHLAFNKGKQPVITLKEIMDRHSGKMDPRDVVTSNGYTLVREHFPTGNALLFRGHWSSWEPGIFIQMCKKYEFKLIGLMLYDDKVGNGFLTILKK